MKTLVVFYSRTGNTKKVSEALSAKLGAETEELKDNVNRSGIRGYLISGREGTSRKLIKLDGLKTNPGEFDLVVVGTPIWWSISSPVRTFLTEQRGKLRNVAFFCTMGGTGDKRTFSEMEEIIGKKPLAVLSLRDSKVKEDNFAEEMEEFISQLRYT